MHKILNADVLLKALRQYGLRGITAKKLNKLRKIPVVSINRCLLQLQNQKLARSRKNPKGRAKIWFPTRSGQPFKHHQKELKRNLTGRQFGKLKVLHRIIDGKKNTRWLCQCTCRKTTIGITGNLINGRHQTCGNWRCRTRAKITFSNGYALVRDFNHSRANPHTGRVREHIVIMERKLGRSLLPLEEVHHKNGIRHDNRPSNLELWSRSHPAGSRVTDLIRWAKQLLKIYKVKP
jgi:hypothetical protein